MNGPGWKLPTHLLSQGASPGEEGDPGELQAMLLTTYDSADTAFLVEHLLPVWCRTARRFPTDESAASFLVELHDALSRISPERMVVVSSARQQDHDDPYPWLLSQCLRPAQTGYGAAATQHAKLWMFVWARNDPKGVKETLEVVVSSANLTRSAFTDQIQAGWRCMVDLALKPTKANLKSWGILPAFLQELAASCGGRRAAIASFADLLSRARCPDGATFLASVPGKHTRRDLRKTPWGLAGLRGVMPQVDAIPKVRLSSPSVGEWRTDDLDAWLKEALCAPQDLTIGWVDFQTDDQCKRGFTLSPKGADLLCDAGVRFGALPVSGDPAMAASLHEEQAHSDRRWLHGKLYGFACGRKHRLLVTSANFSASAWGRWLNDGRLAIENFELGVLLDDTRYPFKLRRLHRDQLHVTEGTARSKPALWADAEWDGEEICVTCRFPKSTELARVALTVNSMNEGRRAQSPPRAWTPDPEAPGQMVIPWKTGNGIPYELEVHSSDENLALVVVTDTRPLDDDDKLVLLGIDQQTASDLRQRMLLERYRGWRLVSAESQRKRSGDGARMEGSGTPAADYSVPALSCARAWFQVVDEWQRQWDATGEQQRYLRSALLRDGKSLIRCLRDRVTPTPGDSYEHVAQRVVIDEFGKRLAACATMEGDSDER